MHSLSIPSYSSHCALGLRMRRMSLSGVTDGDGDCDDIFRLTVVNMIEIDAETCCVSYSSFFAYRARTIYYYRFYGGWNGDADVGAHRVLPHRYPRYYSYHHGVCGEMYCSVDLHFYFAAKVWLPVLAVDDAPPYLQHPLAVASSGGEFRSLIHGLCLWALTTVYLEDVPAILRFP